MATRKSKAKVEDVTEPVLETVTNEEIAAAKPGVVKEYTQNGLRYQRIRKEDGSIVDVRI